jgi:hypothetical protein
MEQRMYHGNINPDVLADYLVNMFNQGYGGTAAQKVGHGNQVLIMSPVSIPVLLIPKAI